MAHLAGTDRSQSVLLPEVLDDYVRPDNPVRFLDAFVTHSRLQDHRRFPPRTFALSKARASAERTIAIDDRLAEGHKSRGLAELFFGWDFPLMERALTRAIALNPQHANAHAWFGVGLALLGRLDEANAEVRRAQELEPILNNLGGRLARRRTRARGPAVRGLIEAAGIGSAAGRGVVSDRELIAATVTDSRRRSLDAARSKRRGGRR